jgi:phospholipase C
MNFGRHFDQNNSDWGSGKTMTMQVVPNRPAISNVLIKASANGAFRAMLLASPTDALADMGLSPDDVEILADVRASSLPDFAREVKMRLMACTPWS